MAKLHMKMPPESTAQYKEAKAIAKRILDLAVAAEALFQLDYRDPEARMKLDDLTCIWSGIGPTIRDNTRWYKDPEGMAKAKEPIVMVYTCPTQG